jgi:hypothetical protein
MTRALPCIGEAPLADWGCPDRASGYGSDRRCREVRVCVSEEARERLVAATAVGAGAATIADRRNVMRAAGDGGSHRTVVDGFAMTDDHRSLRRSETVW